MIQDQPPPQPASGDVWRLVIADVRDPVIQADMEERRLLGIQRYGTPVQVHNGRDVLLDAYEEALDLCVYLRQAIEEGIPVHGIYNSCLENLFSLSYFRRERT